MPPGCGPPPVSANAAQTANLCACFTNAGHMCRAAPDVMGLCDCTN
jgi:hypothetical protein